MTLPHPDPALQTALCHLGCASKGQLSLGGVLAEELATRFGTPLYAYAADVVAARCAAVRSALGPEVGVLYSVKANPSRALCSLLRAQGLGAEVASAGELCVAEAAGWPTAGLRFAGPGKTAAELAFALEAGLGVFHVESAQEVSALAGLCRDRGVTAGVAVRVNLPQELHGARQRMGGRSSRFGVDREQVPGLLAQIAGDPALELRGLHVYGGTQCVSAAAFVAHATALVDAAAEWQRDLGLELRELDLGGGFAVPTYRGDPDFDLAAAGEGVRALVAGPGTGRAWFVELGRWLVAPAGVYLSRVVGTKVSGGVRQAVLDGGLHHCAVAAGVGSVLRRQPLLVAAATLDATERLPHTVGGPLCTPMDQFATEIALPALREGDLLAVLQAGAYGLTYSPTGFLSHPTPAEVLVQDGQARLIRERGRFADALRGQLP